MEPVTKEALEQIIKNAKKAGKDTSKLEDTLKKVDKKEIVPPMAEVKEKKLMKGSRIIESTGPAKEEDFK